MPQFARLYNAGDKIVETMAYTLPDAYDIHCVGRVRVEAPAKGFFQIPISLELGATVVQTGFVRTFLDRHGHKGVVQIDETRPADTIGENEYVATSDAAARRRADEAWREYCKSVVRAWQEEAALARAAGGAPRGPAGFMRRAMEVLGVQDPTEEVFLKAQGAAAENDRIAKLERIVADLTERLGEQTKAPTGAAGSDKAKQPSLPVK